MNEATTLPRLLLSLKQQTLFAHRVLVADGGSSDSTSVIARQHNVTVMDAPKGRGCQIAAALVAVEEDIIVVAHADMVFPANALASIHHFLIEHGRCPGGCLGHRFDGSELVLRTIEFGDWLRGRLGRSYGDQAQFFRRHLLADQGGFPNQPIMEDVELARRLRRLGRPAYLSVPVTVSARRFQGSGWLNVLWKNWKLRRAYDRGGFAECQKLYERYYSTAEAAVRGNP